MIRLDVEAPARTRTSVAFKDDARGLLILADKAREDAALLRRSAGIVAGVRQTGSEQLAGALRSLAAQFEQAADGRDPQAP